jgi:hypothetical protein
MEHIQGCIRSHWIPPSGECLRHIAPMAAIVDKFIETTQNTNKTQLLLSNYSTFRALVVCVNFTPENKWILYSAYRCNKMFKNVRRHDWS